MKQMTTQKLTKKPRTGVLAVCGLLATLGVAVGVTASAWAAPAGSPGSTGSDGQVSAVPSVPAASSAQVALDPAMQRLFMTLAMSVLSNFATSAARGSLDAFDPGPAIESALKGALNSRDVNAVIDRLVAQAGAGSAESGASPEMRAMLKMALTGVVAMARSEIARELSVPAAPAAPAAPPAPAAAP